MKYRVRSVTVIVLLLWLGVVGRSFSQHHNRWGELEPDEVQTIRIECIRAIGIYSPTDHTVDLHLTLRLFPVSTANISVYHVWQVIDAVPVEPHVIWIPKAQTASAARFDDTSAIPIDTGGTELEWTIPC